MDMNLSEPWFSYVRAGRKTIECRLFRDKFRAVHVGQIIRFHHAPPEEIRPIETRVVDIRRYASFAECLERDAFYRILPDTRDIDDGIQIYRKFYNADDEKSYGVIAIEFNVMS